MFRHAALAIAMTAALAGCGETTTNASTSNNATDTTPDASERTQQVAITLSSTGREKHDDAGPDLLDLQGTWPAWGDESSSIAFDPSTNRLLITQPTSDSGISLGVRRFDGELTAGNWYSLTVDAQSTGAAALLFLIHSDGRISPAVTDVNGGLMLATDDQPLSFTAPENIVGFYLQVQSDYQATTEGSLTANVITQFVPDPGTTPDPGGELISIAQQWPLWDGSSSQVSYDAQTERLRIDAPVNGNAIGARKLGFGLQAGSSYQLSALQNTDPGASVLLFLFDAQHRVIPFSGATGQTPWLATSSNAATIFTAPEGVADIGIQVQSSYQAGETAYLIPSLRVAAVGGSDPSVMPVSPPVPPTPERPVPQPGDE